MAGLGGRWQVAAAEGGAGAAGWADIVGIVVVERPPAPSPLPQGEGGFRVGELRALIADCLVLWGVRGRVTPSGDGVEIVVEQGSLLLQRAPADMRPVRWLLHTPERRAGHRPPRAAPSIGAALTVLREALGAERGNKLVIGAIAP